MNTPRAHLWPHLTNHERACLIDWWVTLAAKKETAK